MPSPSFPPSVAEGRPLRYAICGLSSRGIHHYLLPLLKGECTSKGELVAVLDPDPERIQHLNAHLGTHVPGYHQPDNFVAMVRENRPDVLLVTGPDDTHCEYIIAGLRKNLRVIAEKPVVTNCMDMRAVLAAEKESESGSLIVAHNLRYADISRAAKELLLNDAIGRITNAEFTYNLDPRHGASYFCRWHRRRERSGGLSVHKSVHHIDLANWLIGSAPETVFAFGARNFYGPTGSHRPAGENLSQQREKCPYFKEFQKHHGFRGEVHGSWDPLGFTYPHQYPVDTYIYDDKIDIEDTYSSVIRYRSGASLTYSCNFSAAWEGGNLALNGTLGRMEIQWWSGPRRKHEAPDHIRIIPLFGGEPTTIPIAHQEGHGGADTLIRHDLFGTPSEESLRLGLIATSKDGALAVATGEAIWRSVQTGTAYDIDVLLNR